MVRRCLLVLAVALAAAPAARADTIVFRRGSDVWLMAPDGSGQRAVTHGERRYEWPSAADDGTIVAADDAGRLHRLRADGAAIGAPIPTAATAATEDEPAETPTHVRISPDGTRVAYDQVIDGDATTLWTPADATTLSFPGQTLGQEGLVAPSWIGNGQLLLSRDVTVTDEDEPELSLYTVGGGDNSAAPWFDDRRALGDGLRRRRRAHRHADRPDGGRRGRLRRHAAARGAAAVHDRLAVRRARVPLRDRPRDGGHLHLGEPELLAGRHRGSRGPRATASTSRRSARWRTATRSASRS